MQMIRKKISLFVVLVAVLLAFSGCNSEQTFAIEEEKSKPLEEEKMLYGEQYTLTNERYSMTLDAKTTHFVVTDLQTGTI